MSDGEILLSSLSVSFTNKYESPDFTGDVNNVISKTLLKLNPFTPVKKSAKKKKLSATIKGCFKIPLFFELLFT